MNKGKKIALAGNHSTSQDTALALIQSGYTIDYIINMSSDLEGNIAGYHDMSEFSKKHRIPLVRPYSYSLTDERDKSNIIKRKADVLVVFGWQRLIPDWFLNSLLIGAFGTHGSPEPLPKGRGRSVLNWTLIRDKKKYIDNLFRYDVGVDSGEIIASYAFSVNPWDDISILHHKDQMFQQLLLLENLPKILTGKIIYKSQSKGKPTYFPKRTPDDGVIDWNWDTKAIYNLIRAVTKPYPGAFTFYMQEKIMIWAAVPFENFPQFKKYKPGVVISSFADGTFLVKTKDGAILVLEFKSSSWRPTSGQQLTSKKNVSFVKLKESGFL